MLLKKGKSSCVGMFNLLKIFSRLIRPRLSKSWTLENVTATRARVALGTLSDSRSYRYVSTQKDKLGTVSDEDS
jgi:hypothetical protein